MTTYTTTDIVGSISATYMRPLVISVSCKNLRPNSRYYPFFDATDIAVNCEPVYSDGNQTTPNNISGNMGDALFTDANGNLNFNFHVKEKTFHTGTRVLEVRDYYPDPSTYPSGFVYSYARTTFTATGLKQQIQTTVTTVEVVYPIDPVAQSFFTYGIDGGCYVTKIDTYFLSADETVPVYCEIREMVNGYPSTSLVNKYARAALMMNPATAGDHFVPTPGQVYTSTDASVKSTFVFDRPIYLEQDKQYCFVLMSNSNFYNVFVGTIGAKAQENGLTISIPPFTGTMFESQNNFTWTAYQNKAVKFTLYTAKFDTSVQGNLNYYANPPILSVQGTSFTTTNGSNVITYKSVRDHNLVVGDYITLGIQAGTVYNGIPSAEFSGDKVVISTPNSKTLTFLTTSNATSTGQIKNCGSVAFYNVDSQGSGYSSSATATITPTDGNGSGATATLKIVGGKITGLTMNSIGSGYTSAPNLIISDTTGTGAAISLGINAVFYVIQNKKVNSITPQFDSFIPSGTSIASTMATTDGNYEDGSLTSYTKNAFVAANMDSVNRPSKNSWIATVANENAKMSGNKSFEYGMVLSTTNSNISPAIDTKSFAPSIKAVGYDINKQKNEETSGFGILTKETGLVKMIAMTSGGSGYGSGTAAPVVTITSVDGNGSGATGTARIGGVKSVTITAGGSGYKTPPTVSFSSGTAAGYAQIRNGKVVAVFITDSGSAYGSAPTISFAGGSGTGATATAVIGGSTEITGIVITNPGSEYRVAPTVNISTTGGVATGATAVAYLAPFNTELKSTGGNASSKFITKTMNLAQASSGIRVYVTAYSGAPSSFDVYARTGISSSGVNIETKSFAPLHCDYERNQSKLKTDFFEYVFTLDNLASFDAFQLKFVLRSTDPADVPIIKAYQVIVLA